MNIQFTNVGRGKNCWQADIDTSMDDEEVAYDIAMEIKKNGGLMSRDIDINYTDDWKGMIYAGFHKVGTFAPKEAT